MIGQRQLHASLLAVILLAASLEARKLLVGPGKTYAKPSAAAGATQNGDTVEIDPGVYEGDVASWTSANLVLRATGPYAHLKANGVHARGKGTWVITGANCKVENIEFSGAKVPDLNGAGIRQEGSNLTISHCYFHDNENGILTDGGNSDITIEYTEFARNGIGERGKTHNMYIGNINTFTLRHCYSHHAVIGHNIKSRAKRNFILYNRSSNDADGSSSYELDLPDGGEAFVIGNIFQQSPSTDNSSLLAFGMESLGNPGSALYVVNNTFVNDRTNGGTFIAVAGGAVTVKVRNNLFVGNGTMVSVAADTGGNVVSQNPGLVNRAGYDYRLAQGSIAIDKGKDPGSVGSFSLVPVFQYVDPMDGKPRPAKGALDAGAFEFEEGAPVLPGRKGRPAAPRSGRLWNAPSKLLYPTGTGWVDGLGKTPGPGIAPRTRAGDG